MRPYSFGLPCLFALTLMMGASPLAAAGIEVEVDGRPVQFGAVGPMRVGGRVLIPLRAVSESLGAEVEWNAATRTVSGRKGQREFQLPIGASNATINGASRPLDVPAQILSGTTMVPLRFVAEALGAEVDWNASAQRVVVRAPDGGEPASGRVSGDLISVQAEADPPTITLRSEGIRQTYPLGPDAIVLRTEAGKRSETVSLRDLRPGDKIRLRLGPGERTVQVVEATVSGGGAEQPRPDPAGRITGTVVSVLSRGSRRTIALQSQGGRRTFDVPFDAVISRDPGTGRAKRAELDEIREGDRVTVVPDPAGAAERIEAIAAAGEERPTPPRRVTGEVVAVRSQGQAPAITVRTAGRSTTYDVTDEATVTRATLSRPARRVDLADVLAGDQVVVLLDADGAAIKIDATAATAPPQPEGGLRVQGVVVSSRPDGTPPSITIRTGTVRTTYGVVGRTDIFRMNSAGRKIKMTLDDILVADRVAIRLDRSGRVAESIEVIPGDE